MSEWKQVKLGTLAAPGRSVISGPFGSSIGKRFFKSQGVPVIRGNNLTLDFEKFVEKGFVFLSEEKAEELNAYAVRGDIVFTAAGTIGQVGMIPQNSRFEKYVISNKQLRFRPDCSKVNPEFLYYWLASPWTTKNILNRNTGSTVPLINLSTIRSLEVNLPSLPTQHRIAQVLSILDAKIDLNRRLNAELESLAKLLYDYWFLQYDFPLSPDQARALGRPDLTGHPYRSSGGPLTYHPKLKRKIPVGWEVKQLADIATIVMGQSPPGDSYNEEGNGEIFFQGSTDFGWRFPQIRQYTTDPTRIAPQHSILLSVRAPVGTLNIAADTCAIGRGLASLDHVKRYNTFLFQVLQHLQPALERRNATGTTFGSITRNDLHSLPVVVPPNDELIEEYEATISPCTRQIYSNHQQSQELTRLRDWLLPMLMNGQITVKPS